MTTTISLSTYSVEALKKEITRSENALQGLTTSEQRTCVLNYIDEINAELKRKAQAHAA